MTITNFLDNELVDFASYSTIRAIASVIDGQKNASRKVLHTVQAKNITHDIKVSQLSTKMAEFCEYLHGSADPVVVNLAKDYVGTNNLPLLIREGNFGTRFINEASAPRYIFTAKEDIFDKILLKEDTNVLIQQEFEGSKIEPRFFVPTLPLLLVNGSEGIATGFAQKILPRNVKNIIKAIKLVIKEDTTEFTELPRKTITALDKLLLPDYTGYRGSISKTDKENQYQIKGSYEIKNSSTVVINEIPIGYDLKKYTKLLEDLEDKKLIKTFDDESDNHIFKFVVKMSLMDMKHLNDSKILQMFNLTKTVTENFTCLDENNRIIEFNGPHCSTRALLHYIKIKLEYTNKRKEYMMLNINDTIKVLKSKYFFIKNILSNDLIINNKKMVDISTELDGITYIEPLLKTDTSDKRYSYLLNLPVSSLTKERFEKIKLELKSLKKELDELKEKTINSIYLDDLSKI